MKLCPVVPSTWHHLLADREGTFGFSPDLANNINYLNWFSRQSGPKLMDCPVYEGGTLLDPIDLKRVQVKAHPDFLIIPDKRGDKKATLRMIADYIPLFGEEATGVLQGKTLDEYMQCFIELVDTYALRRIAIPKDFTLNTGLPRTEIVSMILPNPIKIHLLGADWPYSDEAICGKWPEVISVDTAEPYNAAIAKQTMDTKPPPRMQSSWDRYLVDAQLLAANIKQTEEMMGCS